MRKRFVQQSDKLHLCKTIPHKTSLVTSATCWTMQPPHHQICTGRNAEFDCCSCAGGGVSRYCTGPLFSKFRRLKGRDTMKRRDVDDFLVFFIVWPISFVVWGFISFGCQCVFVFPNSGLEVLGYILLFTLVGGLFGAWGMGRFYRWVTKV